jgi:hypothetical protein
LVCVCLQDEEGIDPQRVFPISAVTGRGVREVVAAVRAVLDELGPAEVAPETNALNLTRVPRRFAPEVRWLLCGCMYAAACVRLFWCCWGVRVRRCMLWLSSG